MRVRDLCRGRRDRLGHEVEHLATLEVGEAAVRADRDSMLHKLNKISAISSSCHHKILTCLEAIEGELEQTTALSADPLSALERKDHRLGLGDDVHTADSRTYLYQIRI